MATSSVFMPGSARLDKERPHQYEAFAQIRGKMPGCVKLGFEAVLATGTAIPGMRLANELFPRLLTAAERERAFKDYSYPHITLLHQKQKDTCTTLGEELEGAIKSLSSIQSKNPTLFVLPETGQEVLLYDFCQAALVHLRQWQRLNTVFSLALTNVMTGRAKSFERTLKDRSAVTSATPSSVGAPAESSPSSLTKQALTIISHKDFSVDVEFQQIQKTFEELHTTIRGLLTRIAACTEEMELWAHTFSEAPPSNEAKDHALSRLSRYQNVMQIVTQRHQEATGQLIMRIDGALTSAGAIQPGDRRGIEVESTALSVHEYCCRYLIPLLKDWRTVCVGWQKRVHLLAASDTPSFHASHTSVFALLEPKASALEGLTSLLRAGLNFATKTLAGAPAEESTVVKPTHLPLGPLLTQPWTEWYDASSTFSLPAEIDDELGWIESAIRSLSPQATKSEGWQALTQAWAGYKELKGEGVSTRIMYLKNAPLSEEVNWPEELAMHRKTLMGLVLDDLKVKAQTLQEKSAAPTLLVDQNLAHVLFLIRSLLVMSTPPIKELAQEVQTVLEAAQRALPSSGEHVPLLEDHLVRLNALLTV